MKEYELNQEFNHEGKRLKVVKSGESGCTSCYLESECSRGLSWKNVQQYHIFCFAKYRSDNTSVKFILSNHQK